MLVFLTVKILWPTHHFNILSRGKKKQIKESGVLVSAEARLPDKQLHAQWHVSISFSLLFYSSWSPPLKTYYETKITAQVMVKNEHWWIVFLKVINYSWCYQPTRILFSSQVGEFRNPIKHVELKTSSASKDCKHLGITFLT